MNFDIKKYGAYFHDGSLIAVESGKNAIILSLESAEISLDEMQEKIVLSEHSTIKGKLHLDSIQKTYEKDREISRNEISMLHDSGGILHLEISNHSVILNIEWVNYPPHPDVTAYSFYKIEADHIWWENIPDLHDPFW